MAYSQEEAVYIDIKYLATGSYKARSGDAVLDRKSVV